MSDSTLLESTEIPAPKRSWIWFALTSGLVLIFLVSLFLGRYPQAGLVRLEQLQVNELARLLVFNVRLPRLLTALLLGMVMASAGTVFQMIFANPWWSLAFGCLPRGSLRRSARHRLSRSDLDGGARMAIIFAFIGLGFRICLPAACILAIGCCA